MLYVRMALYFLSAGAAGAGIASFDAEANTLTFNLDDLAVILGGFGTFVATFLSSRVAKKNGWRLSKTKRGFLVQGLDEVGAVWRQIEVLGKEKINVTAADAVAAGNGLFGMILWVKPKDYAKAAKILKAK